MAYDKAFEWPLIGPFIEYVGAFPVSTKIGGTAEAIEESLRALEEGSVLIIFPEGERESADGKMHPFKTGAVRIALQSGVPILPVTIIGGNRIWPQEQKFPRFFRRVEVIYHPLFFVKEAPDMDPHENVELLTARLREIISDKDEIRRKNPKIQYLKDV
jgi:1-acyl-sn-glycerol-3-phosphate acyltransferase